jgi:mono/diheme cytochrome c family protein
MTSACAAAVAAAALLARCALAQARFSAAEIALGPKQFDRTCAQCHGRNMTTRTTA